MKKLWGVALFLLCCGPVSAHPMGNFSINHYSEISMNSDGVAIHYIIDMAEIPTFQEMTALDLNGDNRISNSEAARYSQKQALQFQQGLSFTFNGTRYPLQARASNLRILPGAGGLPTLLITAEYLVPWQAKILTEKNSIDYRDSNFEDRIGWKEIVLHRNKELPVLNTDAASTDRSKKLTQYPADPMISPPQETQTVIVFGVAPSFAVRTGEQSATGNGAADQSSSQASKRDDRFTRLISQKDLSGGIILLSLLIAFGLGAMHALSPGHGKTIVAGYLIGSRGTAYHAFFLGAVVTLTHTIGVFALGLITLFGSRYILPETLYPWLSFLSGISILIIGVSLFRKRLRLLNRKHVHDHHPAHSHVHHNDHDHHHHHEDHDHAHNHSHLPVDPQTGAITLRSLLTVGISGGALPCPSALVVLLSAMSLHRIGFGLLLIVAFSLGLAVVLTSIGILLVYASHVTRRFEKHGALLYRMPLASSLIISVLGLAIALKAFL